MRRFVHWPIEADAIRGWVVLEDGRVAAFRLAHMVPGDHGWVPVAGYEARKGRLIVTRWRGGQGHRCLLRARPVADEATALESAWQRLHRRRDWHLHGFRGS